MLRIYTLGRVERTHRRRRRRLMCVNIRDNATIASCTLGGLMPLPVSVCVCGRRALGTANGGGGALNECHTIMMCVPEYFSITRERTAVALSSV